MPSFHLMTNVPGNGVETSDLLALLSKTIAQELGKPESYVLVSLTTDKPMCFGGTEEPCAYAELASIGAIGGDKNKKISSKIMSVIEQKLNVPSNRFYIKFYDAPRTDMGWSGSTF